ncbi:MAG: DsbA family protein [Hyphomonadaceae bacterium]|nr:DsbA family protein [Hyphomonadaceae bacterium]
MNSRFDSLVKIATLSVLGATLLAACGDTGAKSTSGPTEGRSSFEVPGDHAMGNADASVTIVEYASVTCGHCANWDKTVWDDFRKKYVDTGKVRYVFREFPTAPVTLANAGHLLANCAGDDKFFDLIHIQFQRQREILTSDDVKGEYIRLAKSAGMSEADFEACMTNEEEIARLDKVVEDGFAAGVTGTPTFFLNGKKIAAYVLEDFDKEIAQALGEPIPEPETESSETPAEAEGEDQ